MKVLDPKTKTVKVVFKEYNLEGKEACPECGRPFKDYDLKRLNENGRTTCVKCGAKLVK